MQECKTGPVLLILERIIIVLEHSCFNYRALLFRSVYIERCFVLLLVLRSLKFNIMFRIQIRKSSLKLTCFQGKEKGKSTLNTVVLK